nr:hypothetical protein GZ28G7_9 [uncultured archaeon GZfos28G7]
MKVSPHTAQAFHNPFCIGQQFGSVAFGLLILAFMYINYPLVYPISSCTIQTVLEPSV